MMQRAFIDFDNTICPLGDTDIDPFPGCADTIRAMANKGWKICIWSCRASKAVVIDVPKAVQQMKEYLAIHDIPYHEIVYDKPLFDVVIDDRAIGCDNNWTAIKTKLMV